MHLDLSDEETFALLNLLTETIENDRYPLSPRIPTLRGILAEIRADRARIATIVETAHTGVARLQPAPAGAFTAALGGPRYVS